MNDRYLIKTPYGFSRFRGVIKKNAEILIKISFDASSLSCTEDHMLYDGNEWISAKEVTVGQTLMTSAGLSSVSSIDIIQQRTDVFDVIDVEYGNSYYTSGLTSHNCAFLGSSATLISGRKLAVIPTARPILKTTLGVKLFREPVPDHKYVASVDVSRGLGLDYQAMTVVDVTSKPWEVVASYRNNLLPPSMLHEVVVETAKYYREAMVLVETNDVGLRVVEDVLNVSEYENVVMTQVKGKWGTRTGGGFGSTSRPGVKTSPQVKRIGCANLKQLVERDQLVLNDEDILWELGRFVGKNNTFKAEEGAHDDLAMCLVLFAWLTDQVFFKEAHDHTGLREAYLKQAEGSWSEEDLTPFGVVDDGRGEEDDRNRPQWPDYSDPVGW